MIKTRQKTVTEEYGICDFCGAEMEIGGQYRGIYYCIETCSHCGKHICEKHWENDCKIGNTGDDDPWILCPDCSKLVEIKDTAEDVCWRDNQYGIPYCGYLPIVIETGKEMELPYW